MNIVFEKSKNFISGKSAFYSMYAKREALKVKESALLTLVRGLLGGGETIGCGIPGGL